jgi:F-type H+-transporting ATPase subunit delta
MKKLANNDIAKAIYLSTKDKSGAQLRDALADTTKFLARRRLLSRNKEILENLQIIINHKEGIVVAKIRSAEKISHEVKEELHHALNKRYKAKELKLEESQDASLLGGVRIEVGDEVLDLSIKSKIGQLQDHLMQSI